MNKREIFDKVKTHLLTQNKKSINNYRQCMYRGTDGLMCAIGCLIPDEIYTPSIEGKEVIDLIRLRHDIARHLEVKDDIDVKFLDELQYIHDNYYPVKWPEQLRIFEEENFEE